MRVCILRPPVYDVTKYPHKLQEGSMEIKGEFVTTKVGDGTSMRPLRAGCW